MRLPQTLSRLPRATRYRTLHTTRGTQGSVNAAEIAHFSSLSSLWWDEHGEFSFLHKMNPVRMQFVRDKIIEAKRDDGDEGRETGKVLAGLDVLDVGCGGGLFSESLARLGGRTIGIDASSSNINIASLHAAADPHLTPRPVKQHTSLLAPKVVPKPQVGSLEYRHTSSEALLKDEPGKQYDVVCSMEVLEHVDNPAAFLETCGDLVKPGGHLFLSTIARTPLSYALTILAAEHILRKVSVGTHTHSKYVNPEELLGFFTKPFPSSPSKKPWISRRYDGQPTRTEADVRGMIYVPWQGKWLLAPREANKWGGTACNYVFWVRKPLV